MLEEMSSFLKEITLPDAQARIEEAKINADLEKEQLRVDADAEKRKDDHRQERFKWLVGRGYGFALLLFGVSAYLIVDGKVTDGLLVISHVVAVVTGILAGRGLTKRSDTSGDEE